MLPGLKIQTQFLFLFSESAYTERYMGLPLPTENFRGYQKSSLLEQSNWINGKAFFLAHGMANRNVHFQNRMILESEHFCHPFHELGKNLRQNPFGLFQ